MDKRRCRREVCFDRALLNGRRGLGEKMYDVRNLSHCPTIVSLQSRALNYVHTWILHSQKSANTGI